MIAPDSTGIASSALAVADVNVGAIAENGPPRWLHQAGSDRELAARLCAGCPVQRECLELLGCCHQPLEHRVGVDLEHPGRGTNAQSFSQTGQHADE